MNAQLDLEKHRWQERVLLFFVPTAESANWEKQEQILASDPQGLEERDLVVYQLDTAAALANRYRVASEQFTAILVGKDGTEKLRQNEPLSLAKLYSTIDAMPMRRREMRERQ